MNDERAPRWQKWLLMPEVRAWEAVALSLNIEPERINTDRYAWMGAAHPFDEGEEFNDRLAVLLANFTNRAFFPTPCVISMQAPYKCGVRLCEFVQFAISHANWHLPAKLIDSNPISKQTAASAEIPLPTEVSHAALDTVASMALGAQACPDKFTLYWLNGKVDEDAVFAAEALAVLERMRGQQPKALHETTTAASAAGALVNAWLVNRDLPSYMRGRAIDDFAALKVEPLNCNLSEASEILEGSIEVYRDDVVKLLERERMTVPSFLQCVAPAEAGQPSAEVAELVTKTRTDETSQQSGSRIHRTRSRRHALGHVIDKAKQDASEPDNYLSVWPELVRLAESTPPPAPLIGYVDGEGVKYRTSGPNPDAEVKAFTKDALRKQMDPNAR
ncbi:hypothetical protein OYT13_24105 [Pandoraea sp. XJJ-1]|uniref:hypothetical protein n=1 Tax=Pandoraea sp. XJJ-1 TaxID=3002643 RepID=UPI00227E05B2|nr:hypothetical protein [Pandoraea sp. XJJ-1]WAL82780.1 hypothetical protein OYT13_24105 [Pandoraea sp. XJJ-1]